MFKEEVLDLYFSDVFHVSAEVIGDNGAFNISLITDLPLFVDPFLLFNSEKPEYRKLHDQMIDYLRFLRAKSLHGLANPALIGAWYCFSEVKQNWFGFCEVGNTGRGLGRDFAAALNASLVNIFSDFGRERITRGSHLEKLCLIKGGVGRDMISDFTTNLIKDFLLRYTEEFSKKNISEEYLGKISVPKVKFNYELERWMPASFTLPLYQGDYVILTPKDILTKDDTWISHGDMYKQFLEIPVAIENEQLRAQINNYFISVLPQDKEPKKKDISDAISRTIYKYPELIDYYIKIKEDTGEQASQNSIAKVEESDLLYVQQFGLLSELLSRFTPFYKLRETTKEETIEKIRFFKDVIENKGGHRIFYINHEPIKKESDVHILFRLVWHRTPSDVSREVNDGRGPADFKISRGSSDKTIVEFKLASNPQLKRNLQKQVDIYQRASDASTGFKVIIYFTKDELDKVNEILFERDLDKDPNIILIDAREDNKPSASKA